MPPDQDRMRELLEGLEQIHRPSASEGERRAAEWLVERFAELGAEELADAVRLSEAAIRRLDQRWL